MPDARTDVAMSFPSWWWGEVWEALGHWKPDGGKGMRAFAKMFLRRRLLRSLTRERVYAELAFEPSDREPFEPPPDLEPLLRFMRHDHVELLRLRLQGLELDEIAASLGIAPGTARSRYARALQAAREAAR